MFKLIFGYLNLLPTKDRLRKQNYFVKKNLRDLDILYCDFRLNEIYTNHELNHFAKKNNKKIICFIFSWDNLFAGDINKYADLYYVSSNYFKSILTDKHKIQKYKIKTGSNFQLKYFKLKKRKKIFR